MKERTDFLSEKSLEGLEVFQLTTEEKVPASHIYMEAQIFSPDSKRLILHRSAHPHGSDPHDPEHQYLICDLEGDGDLVPITEETGATAPSVSPDGSRLYYFVNQTEVGGGRLILKKVEMDGTDREELLVIDHPLPGTTFRPSRPYPLSTISADGKRLAISAFLGDGRTENAPWGLLVFDLEAGTVELILHGQSWCNVHPQYSRSTDPDEGRDLLIQENHGNLCDPQGKFEKLAGGEGADIHVIRDDGTRMRDLPWGRDGNEFCQGHQCWIGRSARAITSTGTREPQSARLIAGKPIDHVGHQGVRTAGGWRNDLTRELPRPDFYHFATDIAGRKFITDAGPKDRGGELWLAELAEDQEAPLQDVTFLLNPGSSWQKDTHIHPFLSPDGKAGFF
ncbi:MAG: hypothetical protein HOC74_34315, partial [Gemmatimonadetes bacterium]|nr:hypothetical protein [Gemmatimonadota bacterium]